jgi:RimJ/RimL family protein N-acetyltransferase
MKLSFKSFLYFLVFFLFTNFISAVKIDDSSNELFDELEEKEEISSNKDIFQNLQLKPYKNFMAGQKVILRPVFPSDHKEMSFFNDPKVMSHFGNGKISTMETIEERILRQARNNESKPRLYYIWALITHEGIAGQILITYPNETEASTELFYIISPQFGGRGLTTEASKLVINFIKGPFVATVHPTHKASIAVLKKLGFKLDPKRQNIKKYDSIRDYYVLENEI